LAFVAADLGDSHRAVMLHPTGQRWNEPEAGERRDSLGQLRARLGDEQFERAYAQGMTLSLQDALDLAFEKALHPDLPK
jgi:hypothetical protein